MSPTGLEELFENKVDEGFRRLKSEPYDVLLNPSGLNLRYYQVDAIKAAEVGYDPGYLYKTNLILIWRLRWQKRFIQKIQQEPQLMSFG